MIHDKELIRRALLGDQEAQKECTEKGIVLPCWRYGGESEIQELHTGGKPIYAVTCKKTYCGAYGCAHSTQQKAIEYWNTRSAPPIGRCEDCKWSRQPTEQDYIEIGRDVLSYKDSCVCAIFLNQQTQDGKMTFAVTLSRGRNNHGYKWNHPVSRNER